MRLIDPSSTTSRVVARRRHQRALADADAFRLDLSGFHCGSAWGTGRLHAVLGASSWALKPDRVEGTLARLGRTAGLLVDAGYDVCPIAASGRPSGPPDVVVWVCGDETTSDEELSLKEIGAPGVCIGACVDLETWTWIHPEDFEEPRAFEESFLEVLGWWLEEWGVRPSVP